MEADILYDGEIEVPGRQAAEVVRASTACVVSEHTRPELRIHSGWITVHVQAVGRNLGSDTIGAENDIGPGTAVLVVLYRGRARVGHEANRIFRSGAEGCRWSAF